MTLLAQVDEAKSKSSSFQEQQPGPVSNPDEFLATASNSIKRAGASFPGVNQGTPSDFGGNTTKATDKDAPPPSVNAKNKGDGDKDPEPYEYNWNYDKLDDARETHKDRIDEMNAIENRNPLQDHELRHSERHEKRADRRQEAREGMAESGWDITDYENYDTKAFGSKKFSSQDAKWLQGQMEEQGMSQKKSDKLLGKYMDHFHEEGNMNQNITHNDKWSEYGSGEHYIGDMEEGAKVSDYDWGDKMRRPEVQYLKKQGFSDEEIYGEMRNYVAYGNDELDEDAKKYGIGAHRWMGKQGLYDDWGQGEGDTGGGDGGGGDDGGDSGGGDTGGGDTGGGDTGGGDTGGGGGDDGGDTGGGGVGDSPMSPSYNGSYNVQGNPYNANNPGYYYGTDQQAIDTGRHNMISDNAAKAHANGLADIETWQEHAHSRQNYYDNVMHELYSSMGLTGFTGDN